MRSPESLPLFTTFDDYLDLGIQKSRSFLKRMGTHYRELPPADHGDYFDPSLPRQFGVIDIINWTSSFPLGQALIAFELTGDQTFLSWAEGASELYNDKVTRDPVTTTMHDLGFLYLPYSGALYRLTGREDYRAMTLKAADALAKRFLPRGGYLKAWGRMDGRCDDAPTEFVKDAFYSDNHGVTIIDSLMNLSLLYWAWRETGVNRYRIIADTHARTVLKHMRRPDGSCYHAFRFDERTGRPLRPDPYNATPDDKYWARGHAWAVYGFAVCYNYTGDPSYRDASIDFARIMIAYTDARGLVCDNLLDMKRGIQTREVSASVILACGLWELPERVLPKDLLRFRSQLMATLYSADTINGDPDVPGIVRSVGWPYTVWGDYYFIELAARVQRKIAPCWS